METFENLDWPKGLTWIFNVNNPSSRLLRLRLLLQKYEFVIKYASGKQDTHAESLSRCPVCTLEQTGFTAEGILIRWENIRGLHEH
jgi:hypothetical protein